VHLNLKKHGIFKIPPVTHNFPQKIRIIKKNKDHKPSIVFFLFLSVSGNSIFLLCLKTSKELSAVLEKLLFCRAPTMDFLNLGGDIEESILAADNEEQQSDWESRNCR
jgi:hypothetical protein